ncbi:iron transporter FeoB [Steroidobacter denitrificans]|uniref:Fe(2+) transporter FeoB n=1 Tax=Steroidobacter denitrificans TaxID=465721 RepID=A0A127FCA8_STEDE|nr:ferrous iron transporter B [Steroidobacter denitrificans]AMN47261.1 iron transporter FeoB [Steroidobacter denitrificans]
MSAPIQTGLRVALLGNPNCGKTALFNLLTGSRQKVANYAGVTVERKEGLLDTPQGQRVRVVDLPGAYSLNPLSQDEVITRDAILGKLDEPRPDLLICVTDATNLRLNLRLVVEVKRLGLPTVLALNMTDVARRRGVEIDIDALERELGIPVVRTVAVRRGGADDLVRLIQEHLSDRPIAARAWTASDVAGVAETQREVRRILAAAVREPASGMRVDDALDRIVMHPVWGFAILAATLFLMFQSVFAWAQLPMGWIEAGIEMTGALLNAWMPDGILRSLLVDGIVAGVGSVLIFLPQILILFMFILALEDSGYLPRAAFMLDRVMGTVGLSGRSFIPLLSSFACAVPGIMATRHIGNWRDRLTTIMIAPLTTCSARLPVYALIIGAFIPQRKVMGFLNLQGVVLFTLYLAGIVSAMAVAWVLKVSSGRTLLHPLMMELPSYRWPNLRNLFIGLLERAKIFLMRVGTIILSLSILLWFLASYPAPPPEATGAAIQYSLAGMLGRALETVLAPIGFNWQISIALVPGFAAREVAVSALGTVYALSATGDNVAEQLTPMIAASWSAATAYSLLAWYVFAPQCISTLSIVKRETNSIRYPLLMAGYLFALAYLASFLTYRIALAFTGA